MTKLSTDDNSNLAHCFKVNFTFECMTQPTVGPIKCSRGYQTLTSSVNADNSSGRSSL